MHTAQILVRIAYLFFSKRLLCAVMILETFGIELKLIFKVFLLKILCRVW